MATKPLFGNPAVNAPVWSQYAVLIGGLAVTKPSGTPTGGTAATFGFILNDPGAGTPVTTEWDPVGALSEDTPFTDGEESISSQDHTAAGFGVYARTFTGQQKTIQFNAKETTLRTLGIVDDGQYLTDNGTKIEGDIALRDPLKQYSLGFMRLNATMLERWCTKQWAVIDNVTRNFANNESVMQVTALIVPDANRKIWSNYYLGPRA